MNFLMEPIEEAYRKTGIPTECREELCLRLSGIALNYRLTRYSPLKKDLPQTALEIIDETVFRLASCNGVYLKLFKRRKLAPSFGELYEKRFFTSRLFHNIFNDTIRSGYSLEERKKAKEALVKQRINELAHGVLSRAICILPEVSEKTAVRLLACGLVYDVVKGNVVLNAKLEPFSHRLTG